MEEIAKLHEEIAHLSRLALSGNREDLELYVRRIAKRLGKTNPELAKTLETAVGSPKRGSVLRDVAAIPVDNDSRLELIRIEHPADVADPILPEPTAKRLEQIISERGRTKQLADENLLPTRSLLFTGPPGVGKTLAAKWLASRLHVPLMTLDLSAVMSSFLGRTGNNLRNVLDYARGERCILLLDEFDSIAKRRDDAVEVGELKRLVTVLLQEIDSWPANGILVAATNHPELLDPAVWRRFDEILDLQLPDEKLLGKAISRFLNSSTVEASSITFLEKAMRGMSYSDVQRAIQRARRESVIREQPLEECLLESVSEFVATLPKKERQELAVYLFKNGVSQHQANRVTGVARETIRKYSGN